MGGYADPTLSRWVRGHGTALPHVEPGLNDVEPGLDGVGTPLADVGGPGRPYATVAAVAEVRVSLVEGHRRGGLPRRTWFVEGAGVCVIATASQHAITFGLHVTWVNFRALHEHIMEAAA